MLAAVGRSYNATVLKGRITETRKPDEKGDYTMRKVTQKLAPIVMAAAMMFAVALPANAETVCPPHVQGSTDRTVISASNAGTHQHPWVKDSNGNVTQYKTCTITVYNYKYETKCKICGTVLNSYTQSEVSHSVQ